jgi:hypothetical protein
MGDERKALVSEWIDWIKETGLEDMLVSENAEWMYFIYSPVNPVRRYKSQITIH